MQRWCIDGRPHFAACPDGRRLQTCPEHQWLHAFADTSYPALIVDIPQQVLLGKNIQQLVPGYLKESVSRQFLSFWRS